ncbi:hypothetical protein [Vulcaniibacterium tengchongense]|uniref:Secreted protein n=1 Tax=Vulcaniibacterium tengchongense TaxID=1273429 RepID=A0A3N4V784_9GAMM|nr:hypothetical protein [Vulcaniibacterium tengchongense]RPE77225.1 hypothetical protein EDC50_2490 [Vulcaniibacterium tengchongense]
MRRLLRHSRPLLTIPLLLALAACQQPAEEAPRIVDATADTGLQEGGAISTAPVKPEPPRAPKAAPEPDAPPAPALDWSPRALAPGRASLSCALDYATEGDGAALADLGRDALRQALAPCAPRGVMRLRYRGKIDGDFAAAVQRATAVADELGIGKRVLDIDSAGGQVEDAINAGDFIAESRWTIWVREGSICHSACVFVLAAGDVRMVAGQVGIHRIIRMSSTAATRAQLNAELRVVYDRVRAYLERNGAAVAVADLMMAVPNRSLRLLSGEELARYGLDGVNPAQDDLDRLRLMRQCGEDFVRRRDAFVRAFDDRCKEGHNELDALNACGLDLRKRYGFPDPHCPAESPLSEFDLAGAHPPPPGGPEQDGGRAAGASGEAAD